MASVGGKRIILFGATGMVGQGVLRECLLDPEVASVLAVGRSGTGKQHEKLHELTHADFTDFSSVESELCGYDACLFCLGVSSAGMSEAEYRRVTYDYALAAGKTLAKLNPSMTFIYVSGAGTGGRSMWARVKGETENDLLKLPFKAAYMFRPGMIRPMHGVTSKTKLYRAVYAVSGVLFPLINAVAPKLATTSEKVGLAMLVVVKQGAKKPVLETPDINALVAAPAPARA